jgi:F-type H+/Na+-transporting ATPase subunit beta
VAEQFTGLPGKYVPVEQTVSSFREILEGKHDDIPERAFLLKGTIDEVVEAARGARDEKPSGEESEGEEEAENGDDENGGEGENGDAGNGGDYDGDDKKDDES